MDSPKKLRTQFKLLLSVLMMLAVAAAFSFPDAVGSKRKVTVNIKIFKNSANLCYYQISDSSGVVLPDQSVFKTKPSNDVMFTADGVDAQVVADGDALDGPNKGKSAFVGGPRHASFFLDAENNRTETKKVRPQNGRKSRHRINMSCLIGDPAPDAVKVEGPMADDYPRVMLVPAIPWGTPSNQAPEPDMDVEDP